MTLYIFFPSLLVGVTHLCLIKLTSWLANEGIMSAWNLSNRLAQIKITLKCIGINMTFTLRFLCSNRMNLQRRVKEETYSWNIIHGNSLPLALPCVCSTLNQMFSWLGSVWCWRYNLYSFFVGDNIPYVNKRSNEISLVYF